MQFAEVVLTLNSLKLLQASLLRSKYINSIFMIHFVVIYPWVSIMFHWIINPETIYFHIRESWCTTDRKHSKSYINKIKNHCYSVTSTELLGSFYFSQWWNMFHLVPSPSSLKAILYNLTMTSWSTKGFSLNYRRKRVKNGVSKIFLLYSAMCIVYISVGLWILSQFFFFNIPLISSKIMSGSSPTG
jgi:hypothetical protein